MATINQECQEHEWSNQDGERTGLVDLDGGDGFEGGGWHWRDGNAVDGAVPVAGIGVWRAGDVGAGERERHRADGRGERLAGILIEGGLGGVDITDGHPISGNHKRVGVIVRPVCGIERDFISLAGDEAAYRLRDDAGSLQECGLVAHRRRAQKPVVDVVGNAGIVAVVRIKVPTSVHAVEIRPSRGCADIIRR